MELHFAAHAADGICGRLHRQALDKVTVRTRMTASSGGHSPNDPLPEENE